MEKGATRTCQNCGAVVKEEASFCTSCGAAITQAEGAAPAPPPGETPPVPPAGAPPPTPPGAAEAVPHAAPPPPVIPVAKRSKVPLVLGIVGGLLVVVGIAVLVLFLTVWSGGGEGAGTPDALAKKYMQALEKGDVDAYIACFPPEYFENMPFMEEMGIDIKEMVEASLQFIDVKYEGVVLKTESESGDRVVMVTTEGTMHIDTFGMQQEIDLAEEPLEFTMEKDGGNWYLTEDPMRNITGFGNDLDLENLEDFDLEDLGPPPGGGGGMMEDHPPSGG